MTIKTDRERERAIMTDNGAYSNNADQLRTLKHKQCHEKCPDFTVSSE